MLKTPREVAEESDVIISGKIYRNPGKMTGTLRSSGLPKPPHVKEMFSGSDGLLAGMCDGKIWIDHSTTDHQQNKVFTAELEAKGEVTEPAQSPLSSARSVCQRVSCWSVPSPGAWRLSRKARWPSGWEAAKRLIRR